MDKKQSAIKRYLSGHKSYRALEKEFGVNKSTINRWVIEYQNGSLIGQQIEKRANLALMKQPKLEGLPKDVVELQKQLAEEKLRNKLLTAMIDIAEDQLKIPIRKKYGTRQLKK